MDKHNLAKITKLRHELHKNAELSLAEFRTKKLLMDFLTANTALKIVDRGKWFYAVYFSSAPNAQSILFRADFDALPIDETISLPYASTTKGVSHKCGHDGHSACLAGLALEIDRLGSDKNIYFVFQHAEEIGAGGAECAALIDEKHIVRAYALHNRSGFPQGSIAVKNGVTQCASEGLELTFTGKTAHASQPETGANPSAAIAELVLFLSGLSANFNSMVLCTVTHISVGVPSYGIAAGEGKVLLVLRADAEADMKTAERMIFEKAEALCGSSGLALTHAIHERFPETVNHTDAVFAVKTAAAILGKRIIELREPWRASEDFGYYTQKCSGAMFYLGNGEQYPHVHTQEYDFNDAVLESGVDMFYQLSLL